MTAVGRTGWVAYSLFMPADDSFLPTRSSLLSRLKNASDGVSWQAFVDNYGKLIFHVCLRSGLQRQEAEEVVQDTILAVAKGIQNFEYDPEKCAFKTWLLTVTRSKIANQLARQARTGGRVDHGDDSRPTPLLDRVPDAQGQAQWENVWEDEWKQNLMDAAIQRVKQRVAVEHYQMFDLFVLKGWPARDVAKTLGVTIAHVYVAKHRLAKLIQKQFAALEKNCGRELNKVTHL